MLVGDVYLFFMDYRNSDVVIKLLDIYFDNRLLIFVSGCILQIKGHLCHSLILVGFGGVTSIDIIVGPPSIGEWFGDKARGRWWACNHPAQQR